MCLVPSLFSHVISGQSDALGPHLRLEHHPSMGQMSKDDRENLTLFCGTVFLFKTKSDLLPQTSEAQAQLCLGAALPPPPPPAPHCPQIPTLPGGHRVRQKRELNALSFLIRGKHFRLLSLTVFHTESTAFLSQDPGKSLLFCFIFFPMLISFTQRTLINLCFLMEYQTAQQGHLETFPPCHFAKMLNILMD